MDTELKKPWGRKQKVNLITQIFLLVGLGLSAWMKADFQLYLCYALGVTGGNIAFVWGDIRQNQAQANIIQKSATTN